MNIRLAGHDYKYAVEQILLSVFPEERADFRSTDATENLALSTLEVKDGYGVSISKIRYKGKAAEAVVESPSPLPVEKILRDRELQRLVKLSFYRASVRITGNSPPWGAVTGIRPVKLATRYIAENSALPSEAADFLVREYHVAPSRGKLCSYAAEASFRAMEQLNERDVSLYIAIPFCPSRCAYCSFVSQSVEKAFKLVTPYMNALKMEIEQTGKLIKKLGLNVKTVYIGGGTPTSLSAEMLSDLMETTAKNIDLRSCCEYTVEAGRPDTITEDRLRAIKRGGATRISINPQSMRDCVLEVIGRNHTGSDIEKSFALARKLGFDVINMDLIAGLPSDTVEGFKYSLNRVLELGPENITVHTLSIKRGSRLINGGYEIPGGRTVGAMLDYGFDTLYENDFKPYYLYKQKFTPGGYENTGWSRAGTDSLYNICIMEELHSIISVGAGGVTKLVDATTGRIERIFNKKYPREYIDSIDSTVAAKSLISDYRHKGFTKRQLTADDRKHF
jgi:oxygen-independent coproporphyrinogen-3 oxidase